MGGGKEKKESNIKQKWDERGNIEVEEEEEIVTVTNKKTVLLCSSGRSVRKKLFTLLLIHNLSL